MKGISINGKFLGAGLNGVHRTAALFSEALLSRRGDAFDIEIVAPQRAKKDGATDQLHPRVVNGRFGSGQGWEMISLPLATRDRLLVNFCNLGPLMHPNSVVMVHDAQTYLYPGDYSGGQASAYRVLLPLIGRRSRRLLTVSEFAKKSLVANGVATEEKIDVVHNGADHLSWVSADKKILATHELSKSGYALALGSVKSYKNMQCLFDAFAHPSLSDLPLVLAGGPGEDAYRKKGFSALSGVRFLGPVSDAELRALYENAQMFLFPSRTEGFGLPPLEAMAFGCPVIASNAGAMPEVCKDGALLLEPDDIAAWRAAILRFRDPTASLQNRKAAEERAAHFTWQRAGDRLWTLIHDLAA